MPFNHTTSAYHRHENPDLMTELTICESLSSADSPYSKALGIGRSYGNLVGDFLIKKGILQPGSGIMEAGGGYGSLMKGFLQSYSFYVKRAYMADLSMYMLKRQKEALNKWKNLIYYIQTDILDFIETVSNIDIIILNEMIGDLDVIADLNADNLPDDIRNLIKKYNLEVPASGKFNFNIGAIRLVESISRKKIPAFLSEHSCDPIIPNDMDYLKEGLSPDAFPKEIRLYGHSEYNIRFSHLIKTAEGMGRRVMTGPLIELTGLKNTHSMNFIFANKIRRDEKQEIIYEFLDHIREYRWMIIM